MWVVKAMIMFAAAVTIGEDVNCGPSYNSIYYRFFFYFVDARVYADKITTRDVLSHSQRHDEKAKNLLSSWK